MPEPTTHLPEGFANYLAARERDRNEQIDRALQEMTLRERTLVKEAAVMGYVRGVMASAPSTRDVQIPPDATVLREVVAACQAMPDLYPYIAGEAR